MRSPFSPLASYTAWFTCDKTPCLYLPALSGGILPENAGKWPHTPASALCLHLSGGQQVAQVHKPGLDMQRVLGYFYTQSISGLPARAPGKPAMPFHSDVGKESPLSRSAVPPAVRQPCFLEFR